MELIEWLIKNNLVIFFSLFLTQELWIDMIKSLEK